MHTFFLNTTGKVFKNYNEIFDIQHETRKLVSIDVPFSSWEDEELGFMACVQKMGELIDNYKDINNDFNIIIYIDLTSWREYSSIPLGRHRDRFACVEAMMSILMRYVRCTLIDALAENGRTPHEALIIFEENIRPGDGDIRTEDGKNLLHTYMGKLLGIPSAAELAAIAAESEDAAGTVETGRGRLLTEKLKERFKPSFDKAVFDVYEDQFDTFRQEVKGYETADVPYSNLLDAIYKCAGKDGLVRFVRLETDANAALVSKQARARANLRLYFYIFACVEEGHIIIPEKKSSLSEDDHAQSDGTAKPEALSDGAVREFCEIDWGAVVSELGAKKSKYQEKYDEIRHLTAKFSDLKLAPELSALDHEKFALDEFGKRRKTLDIKNVSPKDGKDKAEQDNQDNQDKKDKRTKKERKKKKADDKAAESEDSLFKSDIEKEISFYDTDVPNLFSEDVLKPFADKIGKADPAKNASEDVYIEESRKLFIYHKDFLKKLKAYITEILSSYAGRSLENTPALLRKRTVSAADEDLDDRGRDNKYARSEKDTKSIERVADLSRQAYETAQQRYLEFSAGRSVAITDIEEQCNWFITRVYQIRESLKKLKLVAVGIFVAILILYIPFAVIQWDDITENLMTLTVALLSVALPIVLLYLIFGALAAAQRKKYRQVWSEFKEKSDEAIASNEDAAEKYYELLSFYVPALRWLYEYKLDVDFYIECCKMARAKISHHSAKLHERIVTVGNIIEDLEAGDVDGRARGDGNAANEIDYNVSFCANDGNRSFYSIIDKDFLKKVEKH